MSAVKPPDAYGLQAQLARKRQISYFSVALVTSLLSNTRLCYGCVGVGWEKKLIEQTNAQTLLNYMIRIWHVLGMHWVAKPATGVVSP